MIAVIDYDAGNLKNVCKALQYLGADAEVTRNPARIKSADRVILPGVGAFGDAMRRLEEYGLTDAVRAAAESGRPFLGICLGLQLLFERSEESPGVPGLGILKGEIRRFPKADGWKVPQIGWNSLKIAGPQENPARLFAGLPKEPYVYFVHSYYLQAEDPSIVSAAASYGLTFHAAVEKGNVFACQFHPEKSGETGLHILKNFIGQREA